MGVLKISCLCLLKCNIFRYQQLIKDNLKEVAQLITRYLRNQSNNEPKNIIIFIANLIINSIKLLSREQGKTHADAEGDVMRGLQVVENLCANTSLMMGETLTGISKDMDLTSYR